MDSKSINTDKEPYYGDLEKTRILDNLFKVGRENRDDSWRKMFLDNVADASFSCGEPQVITGPDGFSYFQLNIPEPNKPFQCFVISHMKDDFPLRSGIGVVINPFKGNPDWVFSYGDIVNFHIRDEFYTIATNRNFKKQEIIEKAEQVLVGQPSETILPEFVRPVIREYLKGYGVTDCKLLLMSRNTPDGVLQELVFNLTLDRFESKERFDKVMNGLAWFLPRHYTFVAMNESSVKEHFRPL